MTRSAASFSDAAIERFRSMVRHNPDTGCLEWTGARSGEFGYGAARMDGNHVYSHRAAWIISNGPIPQGMCVLHRCDNPACVLVDHLFLGSRRDNMRDKVSKGRQPVGAYVGGSVLNDAKVAEILHRYATGSESAFGLASEFGVNESTLRSIINGDTWKHVKAPRLPRDQVIAIGKRNRASARRAARTARTTFIPTNS